MILKINSLQICHIAMGMAQTPTLMFAFSDLTTLLSQIPNICAILRGVVLKDIYTICQIIFAKGQQMRKCCIVSS
jgi:hypothetical protein